MTAWDAIVLAGGSSTRLGGGLKPAIEVGGLRMLDRVLGAVSEARHVSVVGPQQLVVPPGIRRVREDPPGGGPVSAVGAGFAAVSDGGEAEFVAIVAGDLPLLTPAAISALLADIRNNDAAEHLDGAVYVDQDERPQWLCGVWRAGSIARRLRGLADDRGSLEGASLRALLGPLRFISVRHVGEAPPPYFDCDTESDIQRAEEWLAR